MQWISCDASIHHGKINSLARFGHSTISIDSSSVWGTELAVVFGGVSHAQAGDVDQHTALQDVLVLQAEADAWFSPQLATTQPAARAFHSAAALGRKMYIFGGHVITYDAEHNKKKRNFFSDLWCLDTDDWQWTKITASNGEGPSKRDMATLTPCGGNKLLLFGGRNEAGRAIGDAWILDVDRCEWMALHVAGPAPFPRKMHIAVKVHNDVYVYGGDREAGPLEDLWALKGLDGSEPFRWQPIKTGKPHPQARFGMAAAMVGEWLVVFGGCIAQAGFLALTQNYVQCKELWALNTATTSWMRVEHDEKLQGPGPSDRMCHTLTPLSDRRMLLVGGRKREGICQDAWWLRRDGSEAGWAAAAPDSSKGGALAPTAREHSDAGKAASAPATNGAGSSAAAAAAAAPAAGSLLQSLLNPLKGVALGRTAAATAAPAAPAAGSAGGSGAATGAGTPPEASARSSNEQQQQQLPNQPEMISTPSSGSQVEADVSANASSSTGGVPSAFNRFTDKVNSFLTNVEERPTAPTTSSASAQFLSRLFAGANPEWVEQQQQLQLQHQAGFLGQHSASRRSTLSVDESTALAVAAAADAAALENLRVSKLGLPATPVSFAATQTSGSTGLDPTQSALPRLLELGQQLLKQQQQQQASMGGGNGSSSSRVANGVFDAGSAISASRTYLSQLTADDIPISHIGLVLADYRHLVAWKAKQKAAAIAGDQSQAARRQASSIDVAALHALVSGCSSSLNHITSADNLRLHDMTVLLREYRRLATERQLHGQHYV